MTNREFLQAKSNERLMDWLEEDYEEPAIEGTDWSLFPNFRPSEFVCDCGLKTCNYSRPEDVVNMSPKLLYILQAIRNKFGSVTITCGARCKGYNDLLLDNGAVDNSPHLNLKAADIYIKNQTSTEAGRDGVLAFAKLIPGYSYGYHNKNGKYPNMGSAVHINVK